MRRTTAADKQSLENRCSTLSTELEIKVEVIREMDARVQELNGEIDRLAAEKAELDK